jgi:UDP-N-acetylglucosamine 2-epimerase (non-hydrolysing)
MKICIVVGTRPEIIKMAPVVRDCQQRNIPFFIVHSNQHYSADMDAIFFEELNLPAPTYNLHVGSGLHSNQTGHILIKIEPILMEEKPDLVLVQGDTNTVLAAALAAAKLGIKLGHIEAGLRSYDRTMPEETNRILTDHMSDYLFSVSSVQSNILLGEGIPKNRIFQVGNTISDSLFHHIPLAAAKSTILEKLQLTPKTYLLLTAHRATNVDIKEHLLELMNLLEAVALRFDRQVVWPIHPRTRIKLETFGITVSSRILLIAPLGYLDFIQLQNNAQVILTDSGGIQEEACMLRVPCITLRENTERPETIEAGANILVSRDTAKAVAALEYWLGMKTYAWTNPFGDGEVAGKIIDIVVEGMPLYDVRPKLKKQETISVIGQGYMGLPIACLIARSGYQVTGVDLDARKVAIINQGKCPFDEAGLPGLLAEVVAKKLFRASTELQSSDIYLVAVPTPHKDHKCDLSYVDKSLEAIAKVARSGQTVIIESTIGPGTCAAAEKRLRSLGLDIDVVHCPERAIPGSTLKELVNNDRIIGATSSGKASARVRAVYESFVKGEIFETDSTTAECVKLVENTSRDVSIAFANELSAVTDELGVNVNDVIKLANRHPRVNVLLPGAGVGGHCIPIDPWFLVENTKAGDFIRHARKVNDQRPFDVAEKALAKLQELGGKRIGLLGVAYKPDVDDCRESPAEAVLEFLKARNVEVRYHDPLVPEWHCERIEDINAMEQWADLLLQVTDHTFYKTWRFSKLRMDSCGKCPVSSNQSVSQAM